jgi:hypothetical protein
MQDHVADTIGGNGTAQQASFRKDSALSLEFIEVARAHPIRQRRHSATLLFAMKREEVLAQAAKPRGANCAACRGLSSSREIVLIIRSETLVTCVDRCGCFFPSLP